MSHPAWVCGLKLSKVLDIILSEVTPCVGVWIETSILILLHLRMMSHPAWVCGLKLRCGRIWSSAFRHTLRGCVDWNNVIGKRKCGEWIVTPCVGVWIETLRLPMVYTMSRSHTLRGCVDWNIIGIIDWWTSDLSHPAWVCGLKLNRYVLIKQVTDVTPCVGVWIETLYQCHGNNRQ